MPVSTPIAFVVFNRPAKTAASFDAIRRRKPAQLYVVADGPRPSRETDAELCQRVRALVDDIDWPCEVHRNYAEHNMGIRRRVSSGLDWVFSMTDRAIILEDDCVPNQDFFGFCEDLLVRYAGDARVGAITGNNFQQGIRRGEASYYFSRYPHCWGWATWKTAWECYDGDMSFWPAWRDSDSWRRALPDPVERRYWRRIFDRAHRGEIDSWAYPWTASVWRHDMLTATPNANLVANVGFGADATHTVSAPSAPVPVKPLGPLTHPRGVWRDDVADRFTFEYNFPGAELRARRRPIGFGRWLFWRSVSALPDSARNGLRRFAEKHGLR